MDIPAGAEFVMRDALEKLLPLGHEALAARIGDPQQSFISHAGNSYQLETEVIWDDKKAGSLRVMAAVDRDGAFGSLTPYMLPEIVEKT